jgi:hypothetical protein
MAIIKLKEAGDTHTARVTDCSVVAGQYGEQVKFVLEGGDTIFVGREPADRQLGRCGFIFEDGETTEVQYSSAIGETLTFSRDANTTKKGAAPYWSIAVAHKSGESTKAPPKRLTEATAKAPDTRSAGRKEFDAAVPLEDAPPAFHRDIPLPESEDGELFTSPTMAKGIAEKRELIESAYRWAYGTAYRAQMDVQDELMKEHSVAFNPTAESVQAGAATILIQMEKRGAI